MAEAVLELGLGVVLEGARPGQTRAVGAGEVAAHVTRLADVPRAGRLWPPLAPRAPWEWGRAVRMQGAPILAPTLKSHGVGARGAGS